MLRSSSRAACCGLRSAVCTARLSESSLTCAGVQRIDVNVSTRFEVFVAHIFTLAAALAIATQPGTKQPLRPVCPGHTTYINLQLMCRLEQLEHLETATVMGPTSVTVRLEGAS